MILFPAIDIYNGRAVRLLGGDYRQLTTYGKPLEMAKRFEDAGAEWVHVVDLNGAEGSGNNFDVINSIVTSTKLKVQSGGGLRDLMKVKQLLSAGATRAVLGTVCVTDPLLVARMISNFGSESIVCGLDAKDGKVTVHGWKENSDMTPLSLGLTLKESGARYFLYTDVSRDGMLTGVNAEATAELSEALEANVIASGGVKDIADLEKLKQTGVYGVVMGKAYYENKIDIKEALELCAK